MKTYLVEAYSDEIVFDKDSHIVALTPEVCYRLDKKGIKYSIIEDYYDAVELSKQVEEYRLSVFRWIDDFDEFLRSNVKGLDLKLATIYRWYLKGRIIDPIYMRTYALRHLFQAIKPSEVTYFVQKPAEQLLDYKFDNYGRSLFSQVIPIVCHEKNILLTTVLQQSDLNESAKIKSTGRNGGLITGLQKKLYKNTAVRRMYFIYRCLKNLPNLKRAGRNKLNIFLLMLSHINEDFIAEALVRGHSVYLLSGDSILKYAWFGTRKYAKITVRASPPDEKNWGNAADSLKNSEIVKWVNEKCQLDVSEIVSERLRHFILRVCPELVNYIKEFIEFYEKARIDISFTPSISTLPEYAALAAANSRPQMKTACLVHGDAVYDSRVWNITELQNFKIHISSNVETKEYFRRLASEIHSPARLYSNPQRFRSIKKIARLRETKGTRFIRKNRVIYAPLFFQWDARRMEGDPTTDTWYYKFQKSLIEYFSTRKDHTFIWKGLPQYEWIYNPIPDFIRDNHFSNVEIATNMLTKHLLTADRIICDSPSTGFYESIIAGVPVMSLYHTSTIVRPGAVAYFGNLLKLFSDIPEAIKQIDDFLNSSPEQFKMKIDMEEGSLFDIIEGNNKGETGFGQ